MTGSLQRGRSRLARLAATIFCIAAILGQVSPRVRAQGFTIPPEIRRIQDKLRGGQEITEAEEAAMEKWGEEMEKKFEAMSKQPPSRPKPAPGKPSPALKGLPTAAPGRDAYLKLVREASAVYGKKAGPARAQIDKTLAGTKKATGGSDLGAMLLLAGGGSASIYATAQTALKQPDDYLAANNLGWALCGMDDYARGLSILLYARELQPKASLAVINLGWANYNLKRADAAKNYFLQASKLDPENPAPHNGLGLIAQDRKQYDAAIEQLWLALTRRYSAAGEYAFIGARSSQKPSPSGEPGEPLSKEKGDAGGCSLPEPPVIQEIGRMAQNGPPLRSAASDLKRRLDSLVARYRALAAQVAQQRARARTRTGRTVEFAQTFDREQFMLRDIVLMTLGEPSRYGQAMQKSQAIYKTLDRQNEQAAQEQLTVQEEFLKDLNTLNAMMQELIACGNNDPCRAKVEARIKQHQAQMDQKAYRACLKHKQFMENNYDAHYRAWRTQWTAFQQGASDYYAFSQPILERVYDPTLNELFNVWREIMVLQRMYNLVMLGDSLSEMARAHEELKCVEPKPEPPSPAPDAAKVGTKGPKCPFTRPVVVSMVVASIELDCTKAKVEFGEGIIGSIQRDFSKKETTVAVGVGFDARNPIAGGGMKMMAEMTVDGAGALKDVAFTQSTSVTAVGQQYETTMRASVMGGPNDTSGMSNETKWDATGLMP